MSQRKSRAPSGGSDDDSSGPRIPPVPQGGRGRRSGGDEFGSPKRRRRHSGRGYDMPREKPREKPLPSKVELKLCVFHGAPSHRWRTAPFVFDRRKDDDKELWKDIRRIYRDELQGIWRRIFGFRKLKHIIPIEVWIPLHDGTSWTLPHSVGSQSTRRLAHTLKMGCMISHLIKGGTMVLPLRAHKG